MRVCANTVAALGLSLALSSALPAGAAAQEAGSQGWITAWATSTQDPLPAGFAVGNPAPDSPQWAQMFPGSQASNQTFRMIVHPNAAGDQVRLRFSNLSGNKPITLDSLSIAERASGKAVAGPSRAAPRSNSPAQTASRSRRGATCSPIRSRLL